MLGTLAFAMESIRVATIKAASDFNIAKWYRFLVLLYVLIHVFPIGKSELTIQSTNEFGFLFSKELGKATISRDTLLILKSLNTQQMKENFKLIENAIQNFDFRCNERTSNLYLQHTYNDSLYATPQSACIAVGMTLPSVSTIDETLQFTQTFASINFPECDLSLTPNEAGLFPFPRKRVRESPKIKCLPTQVELTESGVFFTNGYRLGSDMRNHVRVLYRKRPQLENPNVLVEYKDFETTRKLQYQHASNDRTYDAFFLLGYDNRLYLAINAARQHVPFQRLLCGNQALKSLSFESTCAVPRHTLLEQVREEERIFHKLLTNIPILKASEHVLHVPRMLQKRALGLFGIGLTSILGALGLSASASAATERKLLSKNIESLHDDLKKVAIRLREQQIESDSLRKALIQLEQNQRTFQTFFKTTLSDLNNLLFSQQAVNSVRHALQEARMINIDFANAIRDAVLHQLPSPFFVNSKDYETLYQRAGEQGLTIDTKMSNLLVSIFRENNTVNILIKTPINPNMHKYTFFEVSALPMITEEGNYTILDIPKAIIGTNQMDNTYTLLHRHELPSCFGKPRYCEIDAVVYGFTSGLCPVSIFTNGQPSCTVLQLDHKNLPQLFLKRVGNVIAYTAKAETLVLKNCFQEGGKITTTSFKVNKSGYLPSHGCDFVFSQGNTTYKIFGRKSLVTKVVSTSPRLYFNAGQPPKIKIELPPLVETMFNHTFTNALLQISPLTQMNTRLSMSSVLLIIIITLFMMMVVTCACLHRKLICHTYDLIKTSFEEEDDQRIRESSAPVTKM